MPLVETKEVVKGGAPILLGSCHSDQEHSLRDLKDSNKRSNICVMIVPEEEQSAGLIEKDWLKTSQT